MTLEQFNKKYRYMSDKEKYSTSLDIWEIPKLEDDLYKSDCESYCRFLKAKIKGFEDWDYYYCKLGGNGHCILYKNGDVIDCNIRGIVTLEQYSILYKPTNLKKYNWFTVLSKILFSKGFLLWKKF